MKTRQEFVEAYRHEFSDTILALLVPEKVLISMQLGITIETVRAKLKEIAAKECKVRPDGDEWIVEAYEHRFSHSILVLSRERKKLSRHVRAALKAVDKILADIYDHEVSSLAKVPEAVSTNGHTNGHAVKERL